jgi:hypothetical protein
MKTFGIRLLVVLALAGTACVPTITISTKQDGTTYKATVNKDKFKVPPEVPFVFWKIKNKTTANLTVTVGNFYLGSTKQAPLLCEGQPATTEAGKEGFLACVVINKYRDNNPYCYEVFVNDKPVMDPQVIIKRDNGGRYDFLATCPIHRPEGH